MPSSNLYKRACLTVTLCLTLLLSVTYGQQNPAQQPSQEQPDEVVRISTELVQTDVMVFDKQGRFVDDLKPGDFELLVDGKPQPITFFERITAGSVNEEAQIAAARGGTRATTAAKEDTIKPLDRGRTIVFYIDDLHMAFDSYTRIRDMVLRFINNEMGQNDQVAVVSTSGRIGFLQQFTNNKAVLRAAVARLKYNQYNVKDMQRPPMSEYHALLIDRYDRDTLDYFVDATLRDNPSLPRDSAIQMVMSRARMMLQQASSVTTTTLSTLESLMRSSAQLPGRKLVFFISDGFFLDPRNSDSTVRLRRITDAATRSGTVIYTLDAKGLATGSPDASMEVAIDPSGRLQRAGGGELSALGDALNALASDTGGRAIRNTNALDPGVIKAVKETSAYYLLAWRPETEAQRSGKFRRLEVNVKGRKDLSVRVQRGFFDQTPQTDARNKNNKLASVKTPDDELRTAIGAFYPKRTLPTIVALNYVDTTAMGAVLTVSMQMDGDMLGFSPVNGKQTAVVNLAGSIYDDKGKQAAGFKEDVTIVAEKDNSAELPPGNLRYNYQAKLKPGLYQVRVAARDSHSGKIGSANEWIEIPDLSSRKLTLSSLLVGESTQKATGSKGSDVESPFEGVQLSVDHRFSRSSKLRFLLYIYNAARGVGGGTPADVALQVQVFRDDQPVVTSPLRKVTTEGVADLNRVPYAAEISLQAMPPGQYVLQVSVIDRLAKTSAVQKVRFDIE